MNQAASHLTEGSPEELEKNDFYRQKGAGQGLFQQKVDHLWQGHLPLETAQVYQTDYLTSVDQVIPD